MRIIEISGSIENGMWAYADPYPAPTIVEIPPPDWLDYPVYSQTVTMAVQTATYLETGAHMYREVISIDQLPLERCYQLDALMLWIPKGPDAAITVADLEGALAQSGETLRPGDALLIGTGWDQHWTLPDYLTNPPYFLYEAIDWIIDHQVSLLGGDTPRYDSPTNPQNFFPKFFKQDILLLAPVINLHQVQQPRGKLTALPLKIVGACASPVRALWLEE